MIGDTAFILDIFKRVTDDALRANLVWLVPLGIGLSTSTILISIGLLGLRWQFGSSPYADALWHFIVAAMIAVSVTTLLRHYATPIPGIGYSTVDVLTAMSEWLTRRVQRTALADLDARYRDFWAVVVKPAYWELNELVWYWILRIVLWFGNFVAMFIAARAWLNVAVSLLFGPILLPGAVFHRGRELSWNWAMTVVGNAMVVVAVTFVEHLIVRMFDLVTARWPAHVVSGPDIAGYTTIVAALVIMASGFLFGVSSLTRQLFHAGGHDGAHFGVFALARTAIIRR